MSVSKSGYYKWKYRKENPNKKELARQRDINLIKERIAKLNTSLSITIDLSPFRYNKSKFLLIVNSPSFS